MPFVKSLPDNATPLTVYQGHPEVYGPWSKMSEALMNGASPFSQAERELLFAFAAGVAGSDFVCIAHSEVAYARGVKRGIVEALIEDASSAGVDDQWRPVLDLVRKLMLRPCEVSQSDVDAVFQAGWDELALNHAISIAGRAAFMHRLVAGYGFTPLSREAAAKHAERRIKKGYVNVVPDGRELQGSASKK